MPPYDYTRLQMLLGKADEAATPETNVISLTYFARRVRFVFHASETVWSISALPRNRKRPPQHGPPR